jgi:hypothetical protein
MPHELNKLVGGILKEILHKKFNRGVELMQPMLAVSGPYHPPKETVN